MTASPASEESIGSGPLYDRANKSVTLTENIALKLTQIIRELAQGEYCVLLFLDSCEEDSTAVEIADKVSLTRPRITQIVSSLESRGLVERSKDEYDHRKVNIHITDAGHESVRLQHEIAVSEHARFIEFLGDNADTYLDVLEKVTEYFLSKKA